MLFTYHVKGEMGPGSPVHQRGISERLLQVFELLGLILNASVEQIGQAFRVRVKEASDGNW